ncbi:MAG: acyl-CoA dehydrogenase family protein [Chloroflexi bacterium]|nr:acyl-CoA dehydrogenase family protein [Chloroflexota bacterium]
MRVPTEASFMDMRFTPEQEAWRQEVRAFLKQEMTPEFEAELESQDYTTSTTSLPFSKKLAARGWLGMSWPKKYGGQDRPFMDQAILNEEIGYFRAPTAAHNFGLNQVGTAMLLHGTEEQKLQWLPKITRQEVVFSQAFTEPQAGSDSAAIETRAVPDGDDYIVNGQKIFCTSYHRSDMMYVTTRTDPNVPKHRGISLFVIPVNAPGVSSSRGLTIDHGRENTVFLDNVQVPASNMVGRPNQGWMVMMTALNMERTGLEAPAHSKRNLEDLVAYAREHRRHGKAIIEDPFLRYRLAEAAIEIEVQRMLAWRVAYMRSKGTIGSYEASLQSMRVREFEHRFTNLAMEVVGFFGMLRRESKYAPMLGWVEKAYMNSSSQHAGGTTEIQRNIVALRGLDMPR